MTESVEQPQVNYTREQLEAIAAEELAAHQAKVAAEHAAALAETVAKYPEYHTQ
jgi:hypothetical protein